MKKNTKFKLLTVLLLLIVLSLFAYFGRDIIIPLFFQPQRSDEFEKGVERSEEFEEDIEIVTTNLKIPWEIAFLPENGMLVTQRTGELLYITEGEIEQEYEIEGVNHIGEGGLLGIALHPEYEVNRFLYLYMTVEGETDIENRIVRYTFEEELGLGEEEIVFDGIPGGRTHNGGRIAFGPDGYLYVTTGDAGVVELSQDLNSLAGKFLRITDEGAIPQDNPFDSAVYSYGHRNPQGLVWDNEGRLWSTEHGPTARDELNLIEAGKNYGWPEIRGDEEMEGMETPILHSGNDYTWAPSGMTFFEGRIFFGGLRGQSIYEVSIDNSEVNDFKIHLEKEFGRLRNIKLGPDGMMYILTNNTDGRGNPVETDDKIIKIDPYIFD